MKNNLRCVRTVHRNGNGAKKLTDEYGRKLHKVRYYRDENGDSVKTIELIIQKKRIKHADLQLAND